jgi:hypothetical protein
MQNLKDAVNDPRFKTMCSRLAVMVSVGGTAGTVPLFMAICLGFAIVITHIR